VRVARAKPEEPSPALPSPAKLIIKRNTVVTQATEPKTPVAPVIPKLQF
jgi:hypothetical protein